MKKIVLTGIVLTAIGCTSMSPGGHSCSMPKDGELAFPSNYKSFPTFLTAIQKPNAV